ncbi:MCP four helix bundle domain-containing protein, partial [Desulfoprunum benzoelyticum]|uniref:MCP four helix bundle domain-containing protein n=1 Tax=Desulfoprunum benzoelyticum TaxID=1506996 RepID=UPI001964356E
MQWFVRLKVMHKLMLSFGIVLTITAALGLFASNELASVNDKANEINTNWLPSVRECSQIAILANSFRIAELAHSLSNDDARKAEYEKRLESIGEKIQEVSTGYQKLIASDEERTLFQEASRQWNLFLKEHEKLIDLSKSGQTEEALNHMRGVSRDTFNAASQKLEELIAYNSHGAKVASDESNEIYATSRTTIIGANAA